MSGRGPARAGEAKKPHLPSTTATEASKINLRREGELLEVQLDFSNKVTPVTLNLIQGLVIAGLTRNLVGADPGSSPG